MENPEKVDPKRKNLLINLFSVSKLTKKKWVELADVETPFEGVKKRMIKKQVIEACPRDLSIHLQGRNPQTLVELSKIAEQ